MWNVAFCTGSFFLVLIALWVHRWRNPTCRGRLPPGSMGLPLLGETLQFFKPSTTLDISPFVRERMERYGPIFKTSLVGLRAVMITDPEVCHFVFQQEEKLFQIWYPYTFREAFGSKNMSTLHGLTHKYLRNLVLKLFGLETLKGKLIQAAEDVACRRLSSWAHQSTVELKEAAATMIFNLTAKNLISYDPSETTDDLKENFSAFIKGLISFPINLPGFAFNRCMQGRKKAMRTLKGILKERQSSPERCSGGGDFFDLVMEELKKERTILTEEIALDLMFLLLFASFETTSLATTMAVKFLTDNPRALEELTEEHEEIIKRRENPCSKLTWQEYKSMAFTSQVISETLRLANIAPLMFRKTLKDLQIKGYTIPAGWTVILCPGALHLNPDMYQDPLAFNPCRWKNEVEPNELSKKLMAFGGGMRFCLGADFAKMQIAVFLHCLVTKYRWRSVKGGEIIITPGLRLPDGFHIQLKAKACSNPASVSPSDLPQLDTGKECDKVTELAGSIIVNRRTNRGN